MKLKQRTQRYSNDNPNEEEKQRHSVPHLSDDLVAFCDFVIVQESSFSQVPTRSLEFLPISRSPCTVSRAPTHPFESPRYFSGSYAPFRVPALFLRLLRILSSPRAFLRLLRILSSPRAVSQAPTHPFESPALISRGSYASFLRCFSGSYASFQVPRYFSKPLRCLSSSHAYPFESLRYLSIPEHYLESPRYPSIPEPFSRNPVPFLESPRLSLDSHDSIQAPLDSRNSVQAPLDSSRLLSKSLSTPTTPFQVPLAFHDVFQVPLNSRDVFSSPSHFSRRFFESLSISVTLLESPSIFSSSAK
ncbi:hypothetical protein BS47DRAFT_1396657 [Hydnum rufescens UP504]|uniref:Uncharacterized protein n=1 Tax=Hydnum rufescens UP504 TaxID=1448309 RepID=A0A9P6DQ63_9AGAM|nr:hypothetical protein BS47DRAFT_1396657 [Hydnum rufescens UP504]